jgi:acyl-[acyl carrier protein]--UDP-N-acetylglucosamine O-acyltransferase
MIGGGARISRDIAPFCMATEPKERDYFRHGGILRAQCSDRLE